MPVSPYDNLGPRERQIMDILYRRRRATAEDVRADIPDTLTNAAVRGMLRLLEEKGLLGHDREGARFIYYPTTDPTQVSKSVMRDLVRTFHNNSAGSALAAMIGTFESRLSEAELDRLETMIADARRKGGSR